MVSRERRKTASRVRVVAVRMGSVCVSAGKTHVVRGERVFALDLRGGGRQEVNVHGVVETGGAEIPAHITRQVRARVACVGAGVRMRRRHVGRGELRGGSRVRQAVHLGRRGHHVVHLLHDLVLSLVHDSGLSGGGSGSSCSSGGGMLLVTASRVGVVVDARVTGQLVRAAEALCAARELAGVRLLASVSADVTGLMLEAVEGLVAQRTLVGTRQVRAHVLLGSGLSVLFLGRHLGGHGGHSGSSSHGRMGLDTGVDVGRGSSAVVRRGGGRRVVWIQEAGEIHTGRSALH